MPRLDPHDGIRMRIEGCIASENVGRDRVGLDAVGAPGKRFFDHIGEEGPHAVRAVKGRLPDDPLELITDLIGMGKAGLRLRQGTTIGERHLLCRVAVPRWPRRAPIAHKIPLSPPPLITQRKA
jgi:hypothetical protein